MGERFMIQRISRSTIVTISSLYFILFFTMPIVLFRHIRVSF